MFDPYLGKFTTDMWEWWKANGYEVKVDRYYDPELVDWADVIWFDTCDNNLFSATNPSEALLDDWRFENRNVPWDIHDHDLSKKKVIVRPIDIEVWQGHHAHDKMWDVVDDCIFIAPHIRTLFLEDSRPHESDMKLHTIPCGVNVDKYGFKVRGHGHQIGIVSEVWESKGVDLVLQIALRLKDIDPRYEIHWLGKLQDYHWDQKYTSDFIERNKLPITFHDWVDSVDEFLEDKNYLLHASKKEAFSYATAEAMAKGIKPVLHHFYGAEDLWPGLTWNSIDTAIFEITRGEYDSQSYRDYLSVMGYTVPDMMNRIEGVING
jgi:glycosyltransferase involved in cell wall biosynthesis